MQDEQATIEIAINLHLPCRRKKLLNRGRNNFLQGLWTCKCNIQFLVRELYCGSYLLLFLSQCRVRNYCKYEREKERERVGQSEKVRVTISLDIPLSIVSVFLHFTEADCPWFF